MQINNKEKLIVAVSDCIFSDRIDTEIVTYSLGSCLGITVYDKKLKIGGMAHMMLPDSRLRAEKAEQNPYQFVDIGVTELLKQAFSLGMKKNTMEIKLCGCANVLDTKDLFRIGKRNYMIARKLLWKNSLLILSESIGGEQSRTIRLNIETGDLHVSIGGGVEKIII
ncbi:MAG: chemotaxis protein CheD [Candidatus Aureabacteria bacterium]|nr:chemotaxis protein CheD [Candidatus Auribacterota bacterium]